MQKEHDHPLGLTALIGRWQGSGQGGYPTIDNFNYREYLDITAIPGSASLHYVQRTLLVDAHGVVIKTSHWESGVLRPLAGGRVELACVHINARIELLDGTVEQEPAGGLLLRFSSRLIGNDIRMRSSSRTWHLQDGVLKYDMFMATDKVDQPSLHLEAALQRAEAK